MKIPFYFDNEIGSIELHSEGPVVKIGGRVSYPDWLRGPLRSVVDSVLRANGMLGPDLCRICGEDRKDRSQLIRGGHSCTRH